MKEIQRENALLTGGAGGLDQYIARSLALEGVNIALVDIAENKPLKTKKS